MRAREVANKVVNFILYLTFLLFFSCGLDVYYFVEPPFNSSSISNPSDPSEQFFSFTTADKNQIEQGNVRFLGTDVYYKIYSNLSTMETQRTAINTANSEYTENGINRLNNYGFQKLISDNYSDPLIKVSKTNPENRNIQIRLFDNYPFESEILVSNQDIGKPLRYNGDSFSISSATILQGLDVNTTNLDEESPTYFVLLYAVSVSTLNLSQRIYSSLCPLGYIQLP